MNQVHCGLVNQRHIQSMNLRRSSSIVLRAKRAVASFERLFTSHRDPRNLFCRYCARAQRTDQYIAEEEHAGISRPLSLNNDN